MQETKRVHPSELEVFVNLLNDIIACSNREVARIHAKEQSKWNVEQLNGIVLPEMTELLTYAENQEVFFKYGANQRLLESAYLLTDSLEELNTTVLGMNIVKLQGIYSRI